MNRQLIYAGQIPLETDLLSAQKNDMIALAKLAAAVLGTTTQVNGLGCNANSPAALNVVVSPGEIYSLQNIDGTAYSSLAADTTHQIVKQGILLDAITLACAAPVTAGQSVNYLIQATYADSDSDAVVLPYYNASNPAQAYSGPANAGTTNNTVRKGVCTVSAKVGIAAATGTQVTPAPDAGYTGLYVVTVANGQATVTAGNIAVLAGAPFIGGLPNTVTLHDPAGGYVGAAKLPAGTTAQRPTAPVAGETRLNTDLQSLEAFIAGAWSSVGKVVQFQSALSNGAVSTTTTVALDSLVFTPKATGSKILIIGFGSPTAGFGTSNAQVGFYITKGGSVFGNALQGGLGTTTNSNVTVPFFLALIDTAGVAGTPITYATNIRVDSAGTASVNTISTQHGILILEIEP
jgi:hypothetical protein